MAVSTDGNPTMKQLLEIWRIQIFAPFVLVPTPSHLQIPAHYIRKKKNIKHSFGSACVYAFACQQVHVEHGVGHGGYDCNAVAYNPMQGALACRIVAFTGIRVEPRPRLDDLDRCGSDLQPWGNLCKGYICRIYIIYNTLSPLVHSLTQSWKWKATSLQ